MPARTGVARLRFAASLLAGAAALGLIGCSPAVTASPTAAPTPTFTSPPTIAPSGPPTIEPTVAATTATGAPACTADDLKASHGLVEGAAGSRLTTVVLVAQVACSIDAYPAVGLRDADGAVLVGGVAGGPGRIDLDPDGTYESAVRFGNWCGTDPAFPVTLDLRIGGGEVAVTGSSFPEEGDMPPCNGGGGPVLEAGAWAPSA
jgi:Protein of unknown function (DUF4232)